MVMDTSNQGPTKKGHGRRNEESNPPENVGCAALQAPTRRTGQMAVYTECTQSGQSQEYQAPDVVGLAS
jgi:hypothetical protein